MKWKISDLQNLDQKLNEVLEILNNQKTNYLKMAL